MMVGLFIAEKKGDETRVRSLIFNVCVCRFATYLEACLAGRPRSFFDNSINDFSNYKSGHLFTSPFQDKIFGIPLCSGFNVKGQGGYENKWCGDIKRINVNACTVFFFFRF